MTVFDVVTVGCFVAIAASFYAFSDRNPQTLLRFLLAGAVLAVANQAGNQNHPIIAAALIAAAITFVTTQLNKRA